MIVGTPVSLWESSVDVIEHTMRLEILSIHHFFSWTTLKHNAKRQQVLSIGYEESLVNRVKKLQKSVTLKSAFFP